MSVNVRAVVDPVFLNGELFWGWKDVLAIPEDKIKIIDQKVKMLFGYFLKLSDNLKVCCCHFQFS